MINVFNLHCCGARLTTSQPSPDGSAKTAWKTKKTKQKNIQQRLLWNVRKRKSSSSDVGWYDTFVPTDRSGHARTGRVEVFARETTRPERVRNACVFHSLRPSKRSHRTGIFPDRSSSRRTDGSYSARSNVTTVLSFSDVFSWKVIVYRSRRMYSE